MEILGAGARLYMAAPPAEITQPPFQVPTGIIVTTVFCLIASLRARSSDVCRSLACRQLAEHGNRGHRQQPEDGQRRDHLDQREARQGSLQRCVPGTPIQATEMDVGVHRASYHFSAGVFTPALLMLSSPSGTWCVPDFGAIVTVNVGRVPTGVATTGAS